ncbi:MAG: hypothetical protein D6712_14975 [Chloroflexi bacterium]|nr:MAG: hypothetical protein D6712_14975 [Chloroflexota bacterium]
MIANINTLEQLIDQARRWHDGENVAAVVLQYSPSSSSTYYSTPIFGPPERGQAITLPANYHENLPQGIVDGFTLSFVRDGAWYGDESSAIKNLVSNWNFETDVSGWAGNRGTIAHDTTLSTVGSGCLKLTADGTGASWAGTTPKTALAVTPGVEYTLRCDMRSDTNISMRAGIQWYDASQVFISIDYGTSATSYNTWGEYSVTATAPTGAAYAVAVTLLPPTATPAAGDNFYLDNVRFYSTASATDTSSTNPAVLSLDFDSTLTTPAPVDFDIELSSTSIGNTYVSGEMAVVVGNSTTDMQIDTTTNTTTTATATAEHDYMTVPAARRLGVYAVVKGEDWKLTLVGDTQTLISYPMPIPAQASPVYVSSSAWQLVHLGEIALPQGDTFGHIGISVERVNATSDLTIAAVLIYDADACLAAQNNDAFEPDGYTYQFNYRQNILTYAEPNTAAGFIGARHFWLDGNQVVVGVIGQSGGYNKITKTAFGTTASVTLKNAKRRKAVLIPQ